METPWSSHSCPWRDISSLIPLSTQQRSPCTESYTAPCVATPFHNLDLFGQLSTSFYYEEMCNRLYFIWNLHSSWNSHVASKHTSLGKVNISEVVYVWRSEQFVLRCCSFYSLKAHFYMSQIVMLYLLIGILMHVTNTLIFRRHVSYMWDK